MKYVFPTCVQYQTFLTNFWIKTETEAGQQNQEPRSFFLKKISALVNNWMVQEMSAPGNRRQWAADYISTDRNICGPLLDSFSLFMAQTEKLPPFAGGYAYHGMPAIYFGKQVEKNEFIKGSNWLVINILVPQESIQGMDVQELDHKFADPKTREYYLHPTIRSAAEFGEFDLIVPTDIGGQGITSQLEMKFEIIFDNIKQEKTLMGTITKDNWFK